MTSFTLEQINEIVKGIVVGNTTNTIQSPEQIETANENQITFIGSKKYEKLWLTSKASIAVVNQDITIEPGENKAFIKVKNADLAMSQVLEMFAPPTPHWEQNIHPTAVIHPSVKIGNGVKIGAGCYIGPNVVLGDDCMIYPNVTIFDDCTIGRNTTIWSGTVIRERCHVGAYCLLNANATIGADGFGFRPCPEKGLAKIPHIGNVVLGNHVEIGSGACVDRGKFSSTVLGDGCKIDNLVQIGHNSRLGMFCIMAGNSGLAGSVTLGNGVMIGGSASIKDHTTIGDRAVIGAGSGVTGDVPAGKTYLGYPAFEAKETLRQWATLKNLTNERSKR
jgi:UDP-3-O-[3-hydroxymyristoyl] glucosamine N-acyltransferase